MTYGGKVGGPHYIRGKVWGCPGMARKEAYSFCPLTFAKPRAPPRKDPLGSRALPLELGGVLGYAPGRLALAEAWTGAGTVW